VSDTSDGLRIGTQEREDAIKILSDHMSEGRLSLDEYDQRMSAAVAATTRADLRPLFADLPAPYPAFMAPPAPVPLLPPAGPPPVYYQHAPPPSVYSDKYRVVAGALQIVLPFGTGRFYTGHTSMALAQLLLVFVGVGVIWSLVDGVVLLIGGGTDAHGRQLRV
jgi:hypothetical protein